MNLYRSYIHLWKQSTINSGFSPRLPDYATRFWFEQMEQALPQSCSPRAFLDIGAGNGRLSLLLLSTYSVQGTAVEVQVDPHAWQPITNRFSRFELIEGKVQEILETFDGKKTYSFILLAEVFEHIPPTDVTPFLTALSKILSPDGTLFLTTPNRVVQGPAEQSSMWHEKKPYGHHKHYTYQELATLLEKHGFDIEWHTFECHTIKKILYNRLFYPLSRIDGRFLGSKKIPRIAKLAFRATSMPIMSLARLFFWGISQLVYTIERTHSTEHNSQTMILRIRKSK